MDGCNDLNVELCFEPETESVLYCSNVTNSYCKCLYNVQFIEEECPESTLFSFNQQHCISHTDWVNTCEP